MGFAMQSDSAKNADTPNVRDYRDLLVWQRGITLAKKIYDTTKMFPKKEMFGLSSQLQRAAVSIPSNIAEGQQRRSINDFKRFLTIALGSLGEVDTQLFVARELNYLSSDDLSEARKEIGEIRKMIYGLIRSLEFQQKT